MSNLVTQRSLGKSEYIQNPASTPARNKTHKAPKSKPFYVHFIYNDSLILQSLIYMSPSAYSPVAS